MSVVCRECGRFIASDAGCTHEPLPVSPLTDDTSAERTAAKERCKCASYVLPLWEAPWSAFPTLSRWLAFPTLVHTLERCGHFLSLKVEGGMLIVEWALTGGGP